MAGRKPKPTAVKRLEGNPGHRALPVGEPRYEAANDRAPNGMTAEARKFWHKIAREVVEAGVLRTVDVPAFVLMAEHYALALRAVEEIAAGELTTEDRNGAERKHPLLQVFRDNAAGYRMFAAEFGLTPSSRARVHVPGEGEQLSLADELFAMIGQAVEVGEDGA